MIENINNYPKSIMKNKKDISKIQISKDKKSISLVLDIKYIEAVKEHAKETENSFTGVIKYCI